MKTRFLTILIIIVMVLAAVPSPVQPPSSQPKAKAAPAATNPPSTRNWTPPKTPWGDPDLQGQWPATANIPMQRPANMGTRAILTDEELAQRERQAQTQAEADSEQFAKTSATVTINPPSYWVERGRPNRQASLV